MKETIDVNAIKCSELSNSSDITISLKAVIDAVCKSECGGGYCGIPCAEVEALMRLSSAQPDRWIPCSERLPEEGHDVLITKEPFKIKGYEQEVIKAKRSVDPRSGKIEWWSPEFGTLTNKAVLAWMPPPEPFREEGEQNE